MRISPLLALPVAALSPMIMATGCGESHQCVPGREIACTCSDGSEGSQFCLDDKTYDECLCRGSVWDEYDASRPRDAAVPGRDASLPDAGLARDAAVTDAAVPLSPDTIASGTTTLIDVFAQGQDVWVVDAEGVSLLGLADGALHAEWPAPRPLTAAAFDGTHLVVTDGAKLTTLASSDLTQIADGNLVEACSDAVLLSGSRLVCGPANDWDRVFYTYDALTARLLASSSKYTYNGIPMQRVPGMDAFVTVTVGSSPSDFHLYAVGADNVPTFVNESPYHGDFTANMVMAFDSAMPTHLITSEGLLLRFSAQCGSGSMFESQCFVKDGALGTLTGSQRFIALDNVDTTLVGLVDTRGTSYDPTPDADAGFVLQTIDVPSRSIEAQRIVQLSIGRVVAFRALPDQQLAVLASATGSSLPYEPATPGYTVLRLGLSE